MSHHGWLAPDRVSAVLDLLSPGPPLFCLEFTQDHEPQHLLRIPGKTHHEPWTAKLPENPTQ